jgi:putative holliday junction resolvase
MEQIQNLLRTKPDNARILGLDVGTRWIGLALSDSSLMIATPFQTLEKDGFKKVAKVLVRIIKEHHIIALVIGLPKNMDGTEGPQSQSTRQFAENFKNFYSIPIIFWDERLTSVEAERRMLEADVSRRKRDIHIDQVAASIILQSFLEHYRQS